MTSMNDWDALWMADHVATMLDTDTPLGVLQDAAIAVSAGRIAWVGLQKELPDKPEHCATQVHTLGDRWITPGLIDCHTHVVFSGDRTGEFVQRQQGASYADIARAGGGILATVAATRRAGVDELVDDALPRVLALRAEGVTTLEIKSGYGLDLETERHMLQAARRLGDQTGLQTRTTYLGAHAVPPEFVENADGYVNFICDEVMPALAADGLIDAVDAFNEDIAFDGPQVERIFQRAQELGLPVKLHADQLNDCAGASLAARYSALSADHLEFTSESGVRALATAGTVAVLLPGAYYGLGGGQTPPIAAFRAHNVPMAIATDCNPGSSPTVSILTMMNMACRLFGLTPDEALAGVTRSAAQALGLADEYGTLEAGKRADMVVWEINDPADLSFWLGRNPAKRIIAGGKTL